MKKHPGLIMLFLLMVISSAAPQALQRPPAPEFAGDSVVADTAGNTIKVEINPTLTRDDVQYHVLLVRDLSISLERAFTEGSECKVGGTSGPVLKKTVDKDALVNGTKIVVQLDKGIRSRYYVAVAVSGMSQPDLLLNPQTIPQRVRSPFILYTDTSGMPLQVPRQAPVKAENFYARAFAVSDTESLFMLNFAVDNPSVCSLSVECGGSQISMPGIAAPAGTMLEAATIAEALESAATIPGDSAYCLVSPTPGVYTLYALFRISPAVKLVHYTAKRAAPLQKILAEQKVQITSDSGFANILHTIVALERMPLSTTNPLLQQDSLTAVSDKKEKLFAGALLFSALAHASPTPIKNEESQGVFTNYMQFADTTIKAWDYLKTASQGFARLKRMYQLMCVNNKTGIADPVQVVNNGTLSDYGKPVKERKNYAFYEGYTRFDVDMLFGESSLPAIGPSVPTGTGLQFRISGNIALYEADLADTFNMFESPFLYASDTSRRIIIPTNDSMMEKFSTDGIWVKGCDAEQGEQQYYTGIVPVRLPLKAVGNAVPVDSAFVLVNDTADVGDPVGTVVGGPERSVIQFYILNEENENTDTLKNMKFPEIMLHRQKRRVICDTNYLPGATTEFRLCTSFEDKGKMGYSSLSMERK